MKRSNYIRLNILLMTISFSISIKGQENQINWSVFSGGGGISNASQTILISSVGQSFADISTLAGVKVASGFLVYKPFIITANPDIIAEQKSFHLDQNYPNPFDFSTKIRYQIPVQGFVSLKIYNLMGQEIKTLVDQEQNMGSYEIDFYSAWLESGIYFCRLTSDNFAQTRMMVVAR